LKNFISIFFIYFIILGAVGGLSLFPMQGLELKFISVGVLIFSIYWITRGLQRKSCCKIG